MESLLKILSIDLRKPAELQISRLKPSLVALIWIVHLAAMGGVALGYEEWFITKTPMNLVLLGVILFFLFPLSELKVIMRFMMVAILAFYSEWLGVQYGLIFGNYSYGNNLGFKIEGVPVLISLNWALLVFVTATIASQISGNFWMRLILGSLLMVMLDLLMEPMAPVFDFWEFNGGIAPLSNYIGWFFVAFLLQAIVQKAKVIGDLTICLHLYAVQLIFFAWFNVVYSL